MDLKNKIKDGKSYYENVTLTDILVWYKKLLKRLPDISHLKNVVLFGALASLLIFILFLQRFSLLYEYLPKEPVAGGIYEEGLVGKIEQLNPLFSDISSAESSITSLVFSGLTKENGQRKNVADLADKWEVSEDGKTYKFILKDNIFWQDGAKITAEDVVFTIETIQNPDTKSPLLKVWEGVNVKSEGERGVVFQLKNPYAAFLSETDVSIIPKHLLDQVPARNLRISEFSKKPIGSGPYKVIDFKEGQESQTVILEISENYFGKKPYIPSVIFKSYKDYSRLFEAYTRKEVKGIEKIPTDIQKGELSGINRYQISLAAYDVLYFNLRSGPSKDKALRSAATQVINREEIIKKAYFGDAVAVNGPILSGFLGRDKNLKSNYNPTEARNNLLAAGYILEGGILKKDGKEISLRLLTSDAVSKKNTAQQIKKSFNELGINIVIEAKSMADLSQNYIRPRDYDLLLVSQNLGADPDLYPFWHSTQNNDPGLNFSGYSDRMLDKFLEQARESTDAAFRDARYKEVSKIIFNQTPAIFLVSPDYIYGVSKEVKGIDKMRLSSPKNRFWDISNWYILDRREK